MVYTTDRDAPITYPQVTDRTHFKLNYLDEEDTLIKYDITLEARATVGGVTYIAPFEAQSTVIAEFRYASDKTQIEVTYVRNNQLNPISVPIIIDGRVRPFFGNVWFYVKNFFPELSALRLVNYSRTWYIRQFS